MRRRRRIAGAPVRTASLAWDVVETLIADTLSTSSEVEVGDVLSALAPLKGIGPGLIAAGHLESAQLLLVSGSLELEISVATGSAATEVDENLNPVPGGGTADAQWTLYIPSPTAFVGVLRAAVDKSTRLSLESPPAESDSASKAASNLVDLRALGELKGST